MNDKVKVIDGVTVRDITPELTGDKLQERINEVAESLIKFAKNKKKDKTA